MADNYYILPMTGTGKYAEVARNQVELDAVRAKYLDEIQDTVDANASFTLLLEDPLGRFSGGVGVYVVSNTSVATHTYLTSQPDVLFLGADADSARAAIKQNADVSSVAFRMALGSDAEVDRKIRPLRTERIQSITGTDTTTFTDTNCTAWSALTANALTKFHIECGCDCKSTFTAQCNQGEAAGVVGGAFYNTDDIWYQTTDCARDAQVCLTWVSTSGSNNGIYVANRVIAASQNNFFAGRNQDISGADTRLYKHTACGFTQLACNAQVNITNKTYRLVTAECPCCSGIVNVDLYVWAAACSPPACPQISHAYSYVACDPLNAVGHAGIYSATARCSVCIVDNLAFTNNDGCCCPTTRRYSLTTLGVG